LAGFLRTDHIEPPETNPLTITMPPRKAVDSADAPAPRRSNRISSQAKDELRPAPTTKNNTKKRTAAADPGEQGANTESNKKVFFLCFAHCSFYQIVTDKRIK
jgi:hypothetical protein